MIKINAHVMLLFPKKCLFKSCHMRSISYTIPKMNANYYAVLGVSPTASEKEIKRAYLQKCKEYHPDKNKGSKSMESKFVQANHAYNVLSNVSKRHQYDLKLKNSSHRTGVHYQSPYRWGYNTQARPEDVFREYQRNSYKANARHQRKQNSYRNDPFYNHWKSVYGHGNSHNRDDPFGFKPPNQSHNQLSPKAAKYVLCFLAFLSFIFYVRISIIMKSNGPIRSYPDPNYPYKKRPSPFQNDQQPKTEPKPVDLDLKTEDA